MISVKRVEVTGEVQDETVYIADVPLAVHTITVAYVRTREGAWMHESDVRLQGDGLPHSHGAHLRAGSGYPKWVGDFITAACPDHRGVFACPPLTSAPLLESSSVSTSLTE